DRWGRTHEALRRAGWTLFAERGYDATSTAEIAERAGMSERTLFRHFPTKERLLLADQFDPSMAEAVRARPADEPTMRAVAEGIRQSWSHMSAEDVESTRDRLRIIAEAQTLRGGIERNNEETVAALERALLDRGTGHQQARVAATAVVAGLGAALLDWARSEEITLHSALESALDTLGGA
ncbi:MAG: TetR/AcrR family transcriptional regulator, partial [Dietzia cercidiphylli]